MEQLQGGGAGVADARRFRRTEVDPRALRDGITFLLQGNHSLAFHQVNELVSVAKDFRFEAFSLNQPAQHPNNFFRAAERPVDNFRNRALSGKLVPATSLLSSLSFAPRSCRLPAPTEGHLRCPLKLRF